MATVKGKKSITLNGTDPIRLNGRTEFEWQDDGWADGFFFWSPQRGSVLNVTLAASWDAGFLRIAGNLGARIRDNANGDRQLDGIFCSNRANDVINLRRTDVDVIRTNGGNDRVNIGDVRFELLSTGDGRDIVNLNTTSWVGAVFLGNGNDRITVRDRDAGVNMISGGEGNDRITVRAEAEAIMANRGNDVVENGANWIGSISTGRGRDTVILNKGDVDYISLGRDADTVIARVRGEDASRVFIDGGENTSGGKNRDIDKISFANFRKALDVDLDSGRVNSDQGRFELKNFETVIGGRAGDRIAGNWDDNRLEGRAGRNSIYSGEGADTVVGGGGADRFVFRDVDDRMDRIVDFRRAQNDKIDLREINDDFDFIGRQGFSGDGPEVRFTTGGGQTRIQGDLDGDGDADFTIALNQALNLQQNDFLL